jgi:hypothetical protein
VRELAPFIEPYQRAHRGRGWGSHRVATRWALDGLTAAYWLLVLIGILASAGHIGIIEY